MECVSSGAGGGIAAVKEIAFAERSRALIAEQKAYLLEGLRKAGVEVFGFGLKLIYFSGQKQDWRKPCGRQVF